MISPSDTLSEACGATDMHSLAGHYTLSEGEERYNAGLGTECLSLSPALNLVLLFHMHIFTCDDK